jgi:cytochrome c553
MMLRSVVALVAITAVALVVGFVWLPSVHPDFTAKGLWDAICRAAGVPGSWGNGDVVARKPGTSVVLLPEMARAGASDVVGRGASLALEKCTMCHGARGVSAANAPNLAGQYPEVIVKQMLDYKRGDRESSAMQAIAAPLDDKQVRELAAYYASLPRPRNTPFTDMSKVPPLVRVGDPMRNVAPCASCHGGMEQKLGAPWLEGMPKEYLLAQLTDFASGARANDSHGQMRNMVRSLTKQEIGEVADFYARRAAE